MSVIAKSPEAGELRFGEEEEDDGPTHMSKRVAGPGSVHVRLRLHMCASDGYWLRTRVPRVFASNHAGNIHGHETSPE
jgi:hypothetical protein